MELRAFARSETGEHRATNQDRYWMDERHGVFVVADGMGGMEDGERASSAVVEGIADRTREIHEMMAEGDATTDREHRARIHDFLTGLVNRVNNELYEAGEGEMGSTCELLVLTEGIGFVVHVGDSRTYLVRGGRVHQLTDDHTFAEKLRRKRRSGEIELNNINEEYEHVLTRAVGSDPQIDADTLFFDVQAGDRFLLCTDGVYDVLDDSSVQDVVADEEEDVGRSTDRLVERAIEEGSHDNVTSMLVSVASMGEVEVRRAGPVDTERKVSFLEQIDVFKNLEERELMKILRIVYKQRFDAGEKIIERNDEAEKMFMLLEGEISLRVEGQEIARLPPGAHFGEMALFGSATRSADAVANTDVVVLTVPSDQFWRLVEFDDIQLGNKLLRNLLEQAADRIRETTQELLEERNSAAEKAESLGRARTAGLKAPEIPEDKQKNDSD